FALSSSLTFKIKINFEENHFLGSHLCLTSLFPQLSPSVLGFEALFAYSIHLSRSRFFLVCSSSPSRKTNSISLRVAEELHLFFVGTVRRRRVVGNHNRVAYPSQQGN
ncbi:hypothetical protein Dimus_008186, partial [Dionaea muscipula]